MATCGCDQSPCKPQAPLVSQVPVTHSKVSTGLIHPPYSTILRSLCLTLSPLCLCISIPYYFLARSMPYYSVLLLHCLHHFLHFPSPEHVQSVDHAQSTSLCSQLFQMPLAILSLISAIKIALNNGVVMWTVLYSPSHTLKSHFVHM